MKEERFFYPGSEGNEPTTTSDSNSNHESSLHGSLNNRVPKSYNAERRAVEFNDFLGKDNREPGKEAVDYASNNRRPNAEPLVEKIEEEIKQIILSNFEEYDRISASDPNGSFEMIRQDIYKKLYPHVKDPWNSDLKRAFTLDRIGSVFSSVQREKAK